MGVALTQERTVEDWRRWGENFAVAAQQESATEPVVMALLAVYAELRVANINAAKKATSQTSG
jgi:hypothetical protein